MNFAKDTGIIESGSRFAFSSFRFSTVSDDLPAVVMLRGNRGQHHDAVRNGLDLRPPRRLHDLGVGEVEVGVESGLLGPGLLGSSYLYERRSLSHSVEAIDTHNDVSLVPNSSTAIPDIWLPRNRNYI
jgi:hypothetical protein